MSKKEHIDREYNRLIFIQQDIYNFDVAAYLEHGYPTDEEEEILAPKKKRRHAEIDFDDNVIGFTLKKPK